jgi:serpin B
VLLLALLATACAGAPDETSIDQTSTDQTTTDQTGEAPDMQLISTLEEGDAAAVGQAVNAFGFDLLAQLDADAENTVTSPLSVATLLSMVLAGAGGDTATAMAEVLHLEDPRDVRMGALLDLLTGTEDVTVEVTNGLWADPDIPFETSYTDFTTEVFDATVTQADLGDPQTAADIDEWVRAQTNDLIDGVAEDLGLPDPDMALVLLNAVYFLGEWTTAFDPDRTAPRPFTLPDGSTVDVPTMSMTDAAFELAQGEGYRMLRLPYGEDGRYGMEVLLPDGDLPTMLAGLDAQAWASTVEGLQPQVLTQLALPSFTLEWGSSLRDTLAAMGMAEAFGRDADFSAMTSAGVVLDDVVHKTFIRVDEVGTEAAAITAGGMRATSMPEPNEFIVDRPFAFTISDSQTDTILFLGTVTDPRG